MKKWNIETAAVQGAYVPGDGDARVVPIVQSTTFRYDNAQSVADLFDLKKEGYFYTRLANPTVAAFEGKVAMLEGGVGALAVSSGQSATAMAIFNLAKSGDHIVSSSALYGGSGTLLKHTLKRMNIDCTFVPVDASYEEIRRAFRPNTKLVFAEVLANPALTVLDIEVFAKAAHDGGVPLVVDNTFPSPALCRPFEFGADIVTHSSSKYLDGHAVSLGGVIVDSGNFDFASSDKYPELTEPDETYHGTVYCKAFGKMAYLAKLRLQLLRDIGMVLSPMNAFLANLGAETLHLRMERHSANALALAEFLEKHPKISWVNYPYLPSSPHYERAKKYLKAGSGVLCCGVRGGKEAGGRMMDNLKLAGIVTHVSDVRTSVLHPASMTHRQLSEEELVAAGVPPDLVRVSVGIEHIDDIIADFDQALRAV